MESAPAATIIIPTYNRGSKILNALGSLQNQTFKDFEVVIVNDGSTDNTKEILDEHLPEFDLKVRVINQVNSGRAEVRNNGASVAAGAILIFMDDDMRHEDNAIEQHVSHHVSRPDTILVGNQVEDLRIATTDMQRYRAAISNEWSIKIGVKEGPLIADNLHITAANFSISKKIFFQVGGFDRNLSDTEDYDFAMRAFEQGVPVYYNENIIGWHDDFVTCRSYIERRKQYIRSHKYLKSIKPGLYSKFYRDATGAPSIFKRLMYRTLKGDRWIDLVDRNAFTFLPKSFRYKLYSAIIYANSSL